MSCLFTGLCKSDSVSNLSLDSHGESPDVVDFKQASLIIVYCRANSDVKML